MNIQYIAVNSFKLLPVQFNPDPWNPSLQLQLYVPLRLLHVAFAWQRWVLSSHSSRSKKIFNI